MTVDGFSSVLSIMQRLVSFIDLGQLLTRAKPDHFRLGRIDLQTVYVSCSSLVCS